MKTIKPTLDTVIRLIVACERNPRGARFATSILVLVVVTPFVVGAVKMWLFG